MSNFDAFSDISISPLEELVTDGEITLGRGNIISKIDIREDPGNHPIYSSSSKNNGKMGEYGKYMFDEEMITWSVDGGGNFFYRPKHKFSVTNVSGYIRVNRDKFDYKFLHAILDYQHTFLNFDYQMKAHPSVIRELYEIPTPPLPEQKKIASILTSVDEVIEKTQSQIDKLQDLKKATMNELLTKGIGHTEFKDSELGRIPKSWEVKQYLDVVKVTMPRITMDDTKKYSPVIVRRRHNGIETRGEKSGSSILVKTQYAAVPKTFLISKRQIFHGSCGIVPDNISANAIISKEYLALTTNNKLDLRFLNYFSRTETFQQQIIRTTYGVDVEKFVFKDEWWMKEFIRIPPIEEQREICDTIDSISEKLENAKEKLTKNESLKKSLMQDLLTGKVRVSVN
jgi:type I restriction enzyme, S subunit